MTNENKRINLTANILFSGIGCQERGFENSEVFNIDVLNTSEISKESILSYAAIHCGLTEEMVETYKEYPSREEMAKYLSERNIGYEPDKDKHFDWNKLVKKKTKELEKYYLACILSNNLGDISKIERLSYADLWTCSFPCTDISVCGKMKGLSPDSNTRSSLLWENIRLLKTAKEEGVLPKYILFENVKNLVSKKFIDDFNNLISILDDLGFNTYWDILNSKFCGVPQNRERVFVICIRKDIDKGTYEFPKPFDTGIRLKDVLENNVADKYFLSEDMQKRFKITDESFTKNVVGTTLGGHQTSFGQRNLVYSQNGYMGTLTATDYKQPKQIVLTNNQMQQVGQLYGTEREPNPQAGRVYSQNGISPCLDTCSGGNRMPKTILPLKSNSDNTQELIKNQMGIDKSTNKTSVIEYANCISAREDRGVSNRQAEGTAVLEQLLTPYETSIPIKCFNDDGTVSIKADNTINYKIRKLTPRECFVLMGLAFVDCDKASDIGVADTHLYKQAGNGIVTNCCSLIAEHLYKAQYEEDYICADEKYCNKENVANDIIVRGNYHKSNHDASRVVDEKGIAPCVKENHGTITGVIQRKFQNVSID